MASKLKLLHNPRCSKSRQALALLQEDDIEVEVVEYLKDPPSPAQLKKIFKGLGVEPEEMIRKGEAVYKSEYKGKSLTRDEWAAALHNNPILIERPLLIAGDRAVIGRPPENVLNLARS